MNPQVTQNFDKEADLPSGLRILSLGNQNSSFKKISTVSEFIYKKEGGSLSISHSNSEIGLEAGIYLTIPANSMSVSADVSLTLDDENFMGDLDLVFGPHGLTFSSPALLSIKAVGLDLSQVQTQNLKLYYVNTDTGEWEEMKYDRMIINKDYGFIYVENGRLPHFSRYAIGEMP
jgi:hypothetical protein